MEPIFSRHDERDLLPPELHTPAHYMGSLPMSDRTQGREEYGERGRHGQDHIRTFAGSDHYSRVARSGTRTRKADKNTHLFHIVTQYYLPHDRQRTVEVSLQAVLNIYIYNSQLPSTGSIGMEHRTSFLSFQNASRAVANAAREGKVP